MPQKNYCDDEGKIPSNGARKWSNFILMHSSWALQRSDDEFEERTIKKKNSGLQGRSYCKQKLTTD
jgi:hypothetical protein